MQSEFRSNDKRQAAGTTSSEIGGRACGSNAVPTCNSAHSGGNLPSGFEGEAAESVRLGPLETGVLRTVSYADVFDFPLTAAEIHHNLVGIPATETEVRTVLTESKLLPCYLEQHHSYYTLPSRGNTIAVRRQRAAASAELWPRATHYGQMIVRHFLDPLSDAARETGLA